MTKAAAKSNLPADIAAGFLKNPADLANLQIVKPATVEKFVRELNTCNSKNLKGRKLVGAIGTGGTIASIKKKGIGYPELDFAAILAKAEPALQEHFKVISLDAFCIDSSQMDYRHINDLGIVMAYAWKHLKAPAIGFLVTHGTDTMAYSAAAISLTAGPGLPFSVVFTGSQKTIDSPINDANVNLRHALFTLEALHNADMAEVVVVMGDKAILGTSAVKIDDTLANAFAAPLHHHVTNFAALEYPLRLAPWLKPRRKLAFKPTLWRGAYGHTLIVSSNSGLNPRIIARQIEDPEIQAVLLYSYGAGTVYDGVTDAIMQAARKRTLPVFVVSPVNSEYKIVYESGKKLIDKGVVPLFMTLPTALAKIEIALRLHPGNIKAISSFMKENYVGEIPNEYSRFSPVLER